MVTGAVLATGRYRLGQAGYPAVGVSYGIIGLLIVIMAMTYRPDTAVGLDACGVPLLSQARDLGCVGYFASDGVLELSVFKIRRAIPERVQTT